MSEQQFFPDVPETQAKKGSKKSQNKEVGVGVDAHLTKVELAVGELKDIAQESTARLDEVETMVGTRLDEVETTIEELRGELQGAVNEVLERSAQKDAEMESTIVGMRKEIEQLRRELSACCTAIWTGMVVAVPTHRVEVPKPKEFRGTRSAKDVDNFLWGVE